MPTLIRFFAFLLFVGIIAFGSMIALSVFVEPQDKEVSVRISPRDLLGN